MRFGNLIALVALLGAGCSSSLRDPNRDIDLSPARSVTRGEVLKIAEAYRAHRWKPVKKNVFHGFDRDGIRVDTPDAGYRPEGNRPGWWYPNRKNQGIPYQWGGFDTPAEFDRKIAQGKAAGDIYTEEKRARLDDAVSGEACGIDCSGFISRCWRLERSYSTRELAGLCDELPSYEELKPGDILNLYNNHALLFVKWRDSEKRFFDAYETGSPPTWKVIRHPIDANYARGLGYKPYRYSGIRDDS